MPSSVRHAKAEQHEGQSQLPTSMMADEATNTKANTGNKKLLPSTRGLPGSLVLFSHLAGFYSSFTY
jgi:hypothetical protein